MDKKGPKLDMLSQSDDWRDLCQAAKDCIQMESGGEGIFIAVQV